MKKSEIRIIKKLVEVLVQKEVDARMKRILSEINKPKQNTQIHEIDDISINSLISETINNNVESKEKTNSVFSTFLEDTSVNMSDAERKMFKVGAPQKQHSPKSTNISPQLKDQILRELGTQGLEQILGESVNTPIDNEIISHKPQLINSDDFIVKNNDGAMVTDNKLKVTQDGIDVINNLIAGKDFSKHIQPRNGPLKSSAEKQAEAVARHANNGSNLPAHAKAGLREKMLGTSW